MIISFKKILPVLLGLLIFVGLTKAETPSETRKWIGFGQNFEFYDEDGMPGNQEVNYLC